MDIGTDIADISTDIADIATGITDVVNSADIADWMLRTLRWKQVDAYKVLRGCPVTLISKCVQISNYLTPPLSNTRQRLPVYILVQPAGRSKIGGL